MSDSIPKDDMPQQTPIQDLLRSVPKDAMYYYDLVDTQGHAYGSHQIPIGRECHAAADEIDRLRADLEESQHQLAEANAEITRQQELFDMALSTKFTM